MLAETERSWSRTTSNPSWQTRTRPGGTRRSSGLSEAEGSKWSNPHPRHSYVLRRLAVAYGRHWFREHFRAQGIAAQETDFARSAEEILGGKVDLEVAGFLARGYVLMLMGMRSDPRFWDNPDTRVTFQNVVLLSAALRDLAE